MTGVPFAVRFGLDATDNKVINVADPTEWYTLAGAKDATPRDWILERANWTKLAGRVGDLPIGTAGKPVRDGETFLIKYRFGGEQLSRLAVWDSTQTQTGGVATIRVTVPPSEVANVQTEAGLGSSWPGEVFTGGNGDCIYDLVANADGTMTATVTTAGSGYHFGENFDSGGHGTIAPVNIEVVALAGASATGGWRFVDTDSWIKRTQAEADVRTDRAEGDYQTTVENLHKELKVFHNNAWVTLFSEDDIKAWIASLSLFEGTVQEEGGGAIGAVQFHELPDLSDLSRRTVLGKISHYWTFVGAPNTEVVAEYDIAGLTGGVPGTYQVTTTLGTTALVRVLTATTAKVGVRTLAAGTINAAVLNIAAGALGAGSSASTFTVPDVTKVATPIIGTDLAGALLNPGDWVQVSNRGTAALPDLHWVTIGGDLLAKARADKLFSLTQWVAGGWEKGSLVTDKGAIYRAKQGVTASDARPGAGAAVEQIDVVTVTAPTAVGQAYTLEVNSHPVAYTSITGDDAGKVRDALIAAIKLTAPVALIVTPGKGAQSDKLSLTANAAGTAFVTTLTTTNLSKVTSQANVAGTTNAWEKVELSGGVRWVQTDGDLPLKAPPGEIYFVLASAQAGGTGRLTYWDGGAGKWQDLGGGGGGSGKGLKLSGGLVIYPDELYWDGTGTKPNGKVIGDLLYTAKTNSVERWSGTAWVDVLKNVPFGVPANQDKFVIMDTAGNPSLSNETFRDAAIKSAGPELYSKVMPPGPEPVFIDLGDNKWKVARIFGALEVAGSTIHIFMQGFDQNGALVTPEAELTRIYATLQYGDSNANTVDRSRFLYYDHLSLTWGGRDINSGDGVSVNRAAYPWLDLTITKLYDDYMQIRWHMEYWSYSDQLYSMDAITEWSGTIGHRNLQQIQISSQGQYRIGAQLQITKC